MQQAKCSYVVVSIWVCMIIQLFLVSFRESEMQFHIVKRFISFQIQANIIQKYQADFFVITRFQGVVEAFDGTQVRIEAPTEHEVEFLNRF